MSQKERIGMRDLTYSQWHRTDSLRRYIPDAHSYYFQDVDGAEYMYHNKIIVPWLLYETGRDIGQKIKDSPVLPALSRKSGVKATTVLYKVSKNPNPHADHKTIIRGVREALDELESAGVSDIESFRVQECGSTRWKEMSPREYGLFLMRERMNFMQNL